MTDFKNITNYPNNIPLFPLAGVLLLPKSRLPLNIFEPRYLKMIEDVLATEHRIIGMIQPMSNKDNSPFTKPCFWIIFDIENDRIIE